MFRKQVVNPFSIFKTKMKKNQEKGLYNLDAVQQSTNINLEILQK